MYSLIEFSYIYIYIHEIKNNINEMKESYSKKMKRKFFYSYFG